MSKIRTVKPELFRHEHLFEAEQISGLPLRLIFIGLFTVVDAEGRFRWRPRQLKLDILPYDEINFTAALSALVEFGFVEQYEYGDEYYGHIPTWHKHQSINQREPDSVLPDPQKGCILKPPATDRSTPVNASTVQSDEHTIPVQGIHRPASASSTPSPNSDLVLNESNKPTAVSISEPQAPMIASSTLAEPRTCTPMPIFAPPVPDTVEPMPASLEMEMEMEMEMEGKGKWKSKHPHIRAVPDPVVSVFEHWQKIMDHPKAVLDKQRRRIIRLALDRGYSVADLCLAITGCSLTPHNCGHNDRGERYDGLHLILRSADQIDRFIRNAQHPPKPLNSAEQRLHSNVQAAQEWLKNPPNSKKQPEVPGESH
jgi:hypothetical protein